MFSVFSLMVRVMWEMSALRLLVNLTGQADASVRRLIEAELRLTIFAMALQPLAEILSRKRVVRRGELGGERGAEHAFERLSAVAT